MKWDLSGVDPACVEGASEDVKNGCGEVEFWAVDDKTLKMKWDLSGVDPACVEGASEDVKNGCGLHIHEGMICDDADKIGGHYYNTHMDTDPWLTVDYVANGGETKGETKVDIGVPLSTALARAVIVHQLADGGRIACAQLTHLSTSCTK